MLFVSPRGGDLVHLISQEMLDLNTDSSKGPRIKIPGHGWFGLESVISNPL